MSANSSIEWTDHTFNPWWGCTKVSPGCTHCYADTLATRYGHDVWGPKASRRFFGDKHWAEPLKWNRKAEAEGVRRRVFCASMADVFERHMLPNVQSQLNVERARLWELIDQTPWLDWLLLTKRPENIRWFVWLGWLHEPPHNVWYGTSCESQQYADERIPELLSLPAAVHFLSCEPLLGKVDLEQPMPGQPHGGVYPPWYIQSGVDWVIAGGESGAQSRPCDPAWVRSLRDQCERNSVAFFFKQWGGRIAKSGGRMLDGRTWDEFPESAVPA